MKKAQEKRIGVDHLKFYDDIFMFPDGNAKPSGTSEEILAAGRRMYHELSPETAEFIDFMYENGLFDVLAKEGKAPGGYCTEFPDYDAPFIFSNFNGTSGDVDVLTHEAGHAFAFYRAARHVALSDFHSPTIEACECHSMSMEFLTAPYHALFFGDAVKNTSCPTVRIPSFLFRMAAWWMNFSIKCMKSGAFAGTAKCLLAVA